MVKDSGARREFDGGSVRDIQIGKGREDLLPLREVANFEKYTYNIKDETFLSCIAAYTEDLNEQHLYHALQIFSEEAGWNIYQAIMEVAIHYEEGAEKYDDNNWRKLGGGIPAHCYIDSGLRHYLKFKQGLTDESHDRAVIWNILGLLYTINNIPEKDDLTFFKDRLKYKDKKSCKK